MVDQAGSGNGADSGLAGLYAALEDARGRHGLTGLAIAVEDPELGHQVFAAGPDAMVALDACAEGSGRRWCTVPDLETAPADVFALQALAATALRLALVDPAIDAASALEVAVRRLADVRGIERAGAALRILPRDGSHSAIVEHLAAMPLPGPVVVVDAPGGVAPVGPPPAPGTSGRVELVAVLSRPDTSELEVHLRYGDDRTVGRGPLSRAAAGAADATLVALKELGFVVEGRVAWARTFDTTPERQFLVGVAVSRGDGPTLYGFAPGSSPIESAARATLDAVNRTIRITVRAE